MPRLLESFIIFWVPQANVRKVVNHRIFESTMRQLALQEQAIRLKHKAAAEAEWGEYLSTVKTASAGALRMPVSVDNSENTRL